MVQLESEKLDNGRTIYYEFSIKDSYQIIQKNNHIVSSKFFRPFLINFFSALHHVAKLSVGDLDPVEVATQTFFRVATEYGSRPKKNIRSRTKHARDRN
jgi:hypothetical protein